MKEIEMGENEKRVFKQAMDYATDWCNKHQWEIGAAEMALGAGVIALGVQNGAIVMGKDIVGSALSSFNMGDKLGGAIGGGIGGVAGAIIGSIGVVGMGGGIGIPAALLIGGGALVLGSVGYTGGDLIHNFLNPPIDPTQFFANVSLLALGTALLIDGARRVIKDERFLAALSYVKEGIIYLAKLTAQVVAKTTSELTEFMRKLGNVVPETPVDAAGTVLTATGAVVVGTTIGGSIATGTVTVLGSHAIGALALTLGLVSAPLWPVIAGGAAGLGFGYASWKAARHFGKKIVG